MEGLAKCLLDYSEYLSESNKEHHVSTVPSRQLSSSLSISFLPVTDIHPSKLDSLNSVLCSIDEFQYVDVSEFSPSDAHKKYKYIQKMNGGLCVPCYLLTYSAGNVGNLNFVWRVSGVDKEDFTKSLPTIEAIKKIPTFHTRAMRNVLFTKFGRISPSVKPYMLRYLYSELTGDSSSADTTDQAEIDDRVCQKIELEDPDIIADLRTLNSSETRAKFDTFWKECEAVLNEEIGIAVDDRRHTEVTHLASAISVRDLWERTKQRLPADTPIPSQEWLRLQFWPKSKHAMKTLHYTGRLKIRFMIQQRQFRKSHPDQHYAAAIFHYQREYACMFRQHCTFLSIDDKHRIKVGELP